MVKLEERKIQTEDKKIEELPPVSHVYIPLVQHLGKPCVAEVKPGDSVVRGQIIASVEARVFAPIHSSVSGTVKAVQDWPHPVLGRAKAIVIDSDGKDRVPEHQNPRTPEEVKKLTVEKIREIVFNAGIVGMGGASFPTHIKLNPPGPVDNLIINCAECEPYLTGDYRLMLEKTNEILKGVELIVKCLGVKRVIIAIEDNKPKAIKSFEAVIGFGFSVIGRAPDTEQLTPIELRILKSQYPQGGEKQLIENILGREVPRGKLPFDVGASVQNVGTVFAIYEAVYCDKPLYERVVTVSGSCVQNPKNILVKLGTPIKELISYCGPLKEEPAKIITGGPMMGIAQYTVDVPVIKSTTGVILMNEEEAGGHEEIFCIRCGACVRACPARLMPTSINLASRKQMWQEAKLYGASDCIECGLCSFVCPSNIKLVQSIRRAKMELAKL